MDLDKIRDNKTQEANELFKQLGIDTNKKTNSYTVNSPCHKIDIDESEETKLEFHWTRLSNNSNIGCIAD